MKLEFTGRHLEVTPALKAHVEEHFERIDHIFEGKPATAHVVIEVERGRHRSEVIINWRNEVLTADSTNGDMYQSLTQTINKIEKQARRLKDKVIDKAHKAAKTGVVAAVPEAADEAVPTPAPPRIIESDGMIKKPMAPEEAVIKLEEKSQQFIVFRNAEGGQPAVIFRREDGNYGLIQA